MCQGGGSARVDSGSGQGLRGSQVLNRDERGMCAASTQIMSSTPAEVKLTSANVRPPIVDTYGCAPLVADPKSGTEGERFMRSRECHLVIHFSVRSKSAVETWAVPTGEHRASRGCGCSASQ